MAYGLQIFNSSGQIRLDTTDRTVRMYASYTGTLTIGNIITISVPGMTDDGTWGLNAQQAGNPLNDLLDARIISGGFTLEGSGGYIATVTRS